jgi:hypothetical protein
MLAELNVQTKYMLTSKNEADRTKRQYADLYFFEKENQYYAFEKHLLLSQAQKIQGKARTVMSREVQKDILTEKFDPSDHHDDRNQPRVSGEPNTQSDSIVSTKKFGSTSTEVELDEE